MNEIIQAVSTVGFPIACCCFLLWQNSKQDQYHREEMEKLRETISENTRIIDKLSKIVQRLADKIGIGKEEDY
jgi:hypothetical protein